MASLEKRGGGFRAKFRYGGRQFSCALEVSTEQQASTLLGRLEENLALLNRGRLEVPAGADLGLFLLSDGKLNNKPVARPRLTLKAFFDTYHARATTAKEANTLYTEKIHTAHLLRLIGASTDVRALSVQILQKYVDERSAEKNNRGEPVSHVTIGKEVGTLTAIWNGWGVPQQLVEGVAPTRGLTYRKRKEKPPFQTWEQIERQVARGGLNEAAIQELWDALFLSVAQITELLKHVKDTARAPFVHPMFAFAAHTGARRSEILRSQIDDFDFEASVVRLREKKKDRAREMTFRHVPMSATLARTMRQWFACSSHPGGQLTICTEAGIPLTPQMAAHHFVWGVTDSKWKVLKGWHVLRHSFASNCALKSLDERLISEWMGHVTEEMARRYRHLFPDPQKKALAGVYA